MAAHLRRRGEINSAARAALYVFLQYPPGNLPSTTEILGAPGPPVAVNRRVPHGNQPV